MTGVRFGVMTAPQQVGYADLLRVWQEADEVPEIEHAWLFDHLMPIAGDPHGPAFEGWTLLSALAARTARLRLGLLVTSNRFRPPAVLAKIAATVDVVSGGRLEFGIGVGSRPEPAAHREYAAHGLPFSGSADAVAALGEALPLIRRLWTAAEPFDVAGRHVQLRGAFCNPKPVQSRVPVTVGGRATGTLRLVARHADGWNYPGADVDDALARGAVLDRLCAEIGRDPTEISRSLIVPVAYDAPAGTRETVRRATDAGFGHLVLSLPAPYPPGVARWLAAEVIAAAEG